MPYLRGSNRPYSRAGTTVVAKYAPPTLQNQIDVLKHRVGKNRPEVQYFKADGITRSSTTINPEWFTINVSDALLNETHGNVTFRDMVLGDRWTNLYLKFQAILEFTNSPMFRIVLYHPVVASSTWNPASITAYPDPSAFTVLHDEWINNSGDPDQRKAISRKVSLRGLRSIYNGNSATFEKGRIRMAVLCHPNEAALPVFYMNTLLAFQNK